MLKSLLGFVAGVVLTALIACFIVNTNRRALQAQNEELLSDQRQIQALVTDRDACNAKFQRSTILYDVGLFANETKAWVIPVDTQPQAAGNKRGTFSHYDPRTQTETVHFKSTQ